MEPNENDVQEVIETPEEVGNHDEPETPEEQVDWRAKAEEAEAKAKELEEKNKKLYARVKKGDEKPKAEPSQKDDLTPKDLYALMNAKVHEDDVEEVSRYARSHSMDVGAALKDGKLQAILKYNEELRRTAAAQNTKPARPGSKQVSGDILVKELSEGKVPEKGSKEAEELFWAKRGGRRT